MPTLPDQSKTSETAVELIERDAFQVSEVIPPEPMQRDRVLGAKAAVLASLGVILLAFAIMARPTGRDPATSDDATTTTRITVPSTTTPAADGVSTTRAVVKPPIPPFDSNLPTELPGVISGIDPDGSVVVIDRAQPAPVESEIGLTLDFDSPQLLLGLLGRQPIGLDARIRIVGDELVVEDDAGEPGGSLALGQLAPDGLGGALLVEAMGANQRATLMPLVYDGTEPPDPLVWEIEGQGAEVLGVWEDQIVLHQANRVWLLDLEGRVSLVAEGEILSYDGRHLSRVVCPEPGRCEIVVGDPSQPERYRVPVPATIGALPLYAWTGSVAVSPDGRKLGASVSYGVLSLPAVIDLETGEATSLADGMNRQAPVAWSPDSQWLAYAYTDDVMVWNVPGQRSWRIAVNRELQTLLWRGAGQAPG